jgi:hypothetical protein
MLFNDEIKRWHDGTIGSVRSAAIILPSGSYEMHPG